MTAEVPMVTITERTYKKLLADSEFLDKLFAAGVDNWEGYGEAQGDDEDEDEDDD